ncbi:MAG: RluA family pseudouridine synthase [Desulfovibrionaceae bacterium]|nr:RluA family pseudouridine synthase [Desulfovibrionaceae bacterium]
MTISQNHVIGPGGEGYRLDKALHAFLPDTGLRLRRRLCDDGRVLVDGRPQKPGYKVRTGQEVEIVGGPSVLSPESLGLKIVARGEMFAAVFKPDGVHSAAIAGRDDPSVEALLPELLPDAEPLLLNRLDNPTSGLLLVGFGPKAFDAYRTYEAEGRIRKFYLARVTGRLDGVVTVKRALDADNRATTKVLAGDDPDERRWTVVTSLSHDHGRDTTLTRCLILKGARHQIRVHLASIGHAIVGDPLYGEADERLFLHHYRVELPGFAAEIPPQF